MTESAGLQNHAIQTARIQRSRPAYVVATIAVIALGLASRKFPGLFPAFLDKYPGDAFWALMVFLLIGIAFPRRSTIWVAAAALAFSLAIEFSQLYRAQWIDSIRATTPGHLVLGSGFAWADMIAYTVGVGSSALAERLLLRKLEGSPPNSA